MKRTNLSGYRKHPKESIHCLRSIAFDDIFRNGIGAADFTEPAGVGAWDALLCEVIHFDQAEHCYTI